jgi:hypothetical protein
MRYHHRFHPILLVGFHPQISPISNHHLILITLIILIIPVLFVSFLIFTLSPILKICLHFIALFCSTLLIITLTLISTVPLNFPLISLILHILIICSVSRITICQMTNRPNHLHPLPQASIHMHFCLLSLSFWNPIYSYPLS